MSPHVCHSTTCGSNPRRLMRFFCMCHFVLCSLALASSTPGFTLSYEPENPEHYNDSADIVQIPYANISVLLSKFNSRFEVMSQCRNPQSPCQCLWNLDYLKEMVIRDSNTTENNSTFSTTQTRQLSSLMLANILSVGQFNQWPFSEYVTCRTTATLHKQTWQNMSYYDMHREYVLTQLMPSVSMIVRSSMVTPVNRNTSIHQIGYLRNDLELLLRTIGRLIRVDDTAHSISQQSCINSQMLLSELETSFANESLDGNQEEDGSNVYYAYMEHIAWLIVNHLSSGDCIELFDSKFVQDIVTRYSSNYDGDGGANETTHRLIDYNGFEKLLNDLHIGGFKEATKSHNVTEDIHEHDHDHDHDHDHPHPHHHDHPEHDHHHHEDHNGHSTRDHRSISKVSNAMHNHIGYHHKHDIENEDLIDNIAQSPVDCMHVDFYWNQLKQNSRSGYITENDIRYLSPIFIQQILSNACEKTEMFKDYLVPNQSNQSKIIDHRVHHHRSSSRMLIHKVSAFEVYVYSSFAVLLISLTSVAGFLLIPFIKTKAYNHAINLLIGLAFGSMTGDALFHMLPSVLGIHSHSHSHNSTNETGHSAEHHEHSEKKDYIYFTMGTMFTIYALFLFELISNFFAKKFNTNHHHHHHMPDKSNHTPSKVHSYQTHDSHNDIHHHHHHLDLSNNALAGSEIDNNNTPYSSSLTIDTSVSNPKNKEENILKNSHSDSTASLSDHSALGKKHDNTPILWGLSSLALIITLGDSIHNFCDGIAIGIAFSNSLASGVSTSIAVFCHELPHEFGDFAVLISTGLSVKRAATINFISALTAFIGLYIGIWLGTDEVANRWALAVCAGLFMYVALCDMLPELKEMPEDNSTKEWLISTFVKNFGVLLGYGFMIILSLYEDKLNF